MKVFWLQGLSHCLYGRPVGCSLARAIATEYYETGSMSVDTTILVYELLVLGSRAAAQQASALTVDRSVVEELKLACCVCVQFEQLKQQNACSSSCITLQDRLQAAAATQTL